MGSKISNTEWGLVIGVGIVLDIGQYFLDFFVIGVFINPFIDIGVGMALPLYFSLRGIKVDMKKGLAWLGSGVIESLTAGLIPLWTADIVITLFLDKADKKLKAIVGGGATGSKNQQEPGRLAGNIRPQTNQQSGVNNQKAA
jgi:hypothetical protein